MNRTTRRLALTDVGANYLERTRRILADLDEAEAMAGANTQDARGVVRVLVPPAVSVHTHYAAALAGLGVTGLPSHVAEDALMEHALERILPEWHVFSATLWATMPTRQHLPARTRPMLDFLLTIFGGEDRGPWLAATSCATPRHG